MTSLYAGRYRTVVQFQVASTTQDALGEISRAVVDGIRTGAYVRAAPQSEQDRGGLSYPEDGVIVDVRYSPSFDNINTTSFMVIRGRTYEIVSVNERNFLNRELRFIGRPIR